MDKIIGFIGSGNMATAMIGGIVNSKLVSPNKIMASNPTKAKLQELSEKYKINITTNNHEVAKESDILILAVKPQYYPEVIEEIKEDVKKDVIIVSIAAGQKIEKIENVWCRLEDDSNSN